MEKRTIELFDILLRHQGNKDHEIPKAGVSATEIKLLRAMHGEESILDAAIKPHVVAGKHITRDVDLKTELFELAKKYANTADPMSAKKKIESVFATTLVGYDKWVSELMEIEQMEQEDAMKRRNEEAARQRHQRAKAEAEAALAGR